MEELAWGYGLVEAPRVDAEDNLYFSDVIGGGVFRRSPGGAIETVVPKRRGVGGLLLHADGGVVVSGRNVAHVRNGETRLLLEVAGVVGFNDMTSDAAGRVYAGSLRSSAFEEGPRVPGELWRIDAAGRGTAVYDGVEFVNGVGFSPDARTIYHSNYSEGVVLAHEVDAEGRGTGRRAFVRLPKGKPDGLAVDENGAVWVAGGEAGVVFRFTPKGDLDGVVEVPAPFVTSLCFGGADRRDLYVVTAANRDRPERRGTIFRTRSAVAGLVAPLARV
ncbi:MAG: SMP-30/gluconolactonase/LRE family protein [Candidatus Binatia bacterium]